MPSSTPDPARHDTSPSTLITGAASGLGRHLTGAFLERGYRVAASDLDLERLEAVAQDDGWPAERSLLLTLDVTQEEDWERTFATLEEHSVGGPGGPDLMINNAGFLRPGWILEISTEDLERHLAVNTRGVILGTRAAGRRMAARGAGHIVNIASLAGITAVPGLALYSASKFAVRGFSLAAAEELAAHGVAVTVVCPDAMQTPMLDLQLDYAEADLAFSGPRVLEVTDIERVLFRKVLPKRPLEVMVPRSRGWTAKLTSAWPRLIRPLAGKLQKLGRRKRQEMQNEATARQDGGPQEG